MELAELYRMLNIMTTESESLQGQINMLRQRPIQIDNIYKEGWLMKEDKKIWRPCWAYIENGTFKLRYTKSKNEAIPSTFELNVPDSPSTQSAQNQKAISTTAWEISLDQAAVESLHIAVLKRQAFQLLDKKGEKHTFSANSLQEVEEWVNSVKVASRLLHDKDPRPVQMKVKSGVLIDRKISILSKKSSVRRSKKNFENEESTEVETENEEEDINFSVPADADDQESFQSSEMSISDFEMHSVIGRGKFAKVLLCSQKSTGKMFAVKVINKNEFESDHSILKNEGHILRSIRHPFIVGLYRAFQSKDRLYLLLEYVNGGE
ncbi:Serine/threonine-protein kinase Sgk2, partial [Nowakowskiella sp. JEL0078]